MNISAYSIKNPLFAILMFTLLMMGGIFGFQQMKIKQFPDVDFPMVITTVALPGAAPDQLENDVTTVALKFNLEKDIQEAVDDVRSAMNEIQGDLPAAAHDPIDRRLSGIKGINKIGRIGGISRIVTVAVDPNQLSALQLPIGELSQQISALQRDASGGIAKVGGHNQLIRIMGAVDSASELEQLQIPLATGGTESLANIATITDGDAERRSIAQLNGETVVAFNVFRTKDADRVKVAKQVEASLKQLQK